MSNYYLFSDGSYHSEDELQHYGVPGMKWGQRRALKREAKVAKKYRKVGMQEGRADYWKNKAATASKSHESSAQVFDKQAKKMEAQGKYFKAEAARRAASAIRTRGENVASRHAAIGNRYAKKAARLNEKASKFASKKRVDLGKKRINSILSESRQEGTAREARMDNLNREYQLRENLGDTGYSVYNKLRGKA